jgi:hypothetical protein
MKKNKKAILFVFLVLFMFVFSGSHAFGADMYKNQEIIPGASGQTDCLPDYIKQIIGFGFAVIGILAMFMLCIGAYQYLMAAGNIGSVEKAKDTIASALLGLVLGLTAWIILYKINPDLVSMRLDCSGSAAGTPGGGGLTGPASSGTSYKTDNAGTVPAAKKERIAKYDQYVKDAAQKYGVPENAIRAIIDKESGWDPTAVGKKNPADKGMMQINQTSHPKFFASNNWQDPAANINYGTSLLAEGYKYTGSWEGAAGYFHRGPKKWNDSRGQTYSADFATKQQQYANSGY